MTKYTVPEEQNGKRLDVFVTNRMPQLSRASVQKLINEQRIVVNAKPQKAGYKLHSHDSVSVNFDVKELKKIPMLNLPILYEDDDCIVINKPAGILTHSKGAFNPEATVASFLKSKIKGMSGDRAGIVHRLDRPTSGVLIAAKQPKALQWLQQQFSQRKAKKVYKAMVVGSLKPPRALIDMPIERHPKKPKIFRVGSQGKSAKTEYEVMQSSKGSSLVTVRPLTGRTHQIRVHMAKINHPIVGDILYGGPPADRLYLHASSLEIILPNGTRKTFNAKLPKGFEL